MTLSRFAKFAGLALLLMFFPFQLVFAQTFYDVPATYKFSESINAMTKLGVVGGYPDGNFQPDKTISRAEAVKILMTATKPQSTIDETQNNLNSSANPPSFLDVGNGEWYAPYVALAAQSGVVKGYPDGTFQPGKTINFAEGLKMILETYGADSTRARFVEHPLLLVTSGDWFAHYFEYAYNHNLINREKFYDPAQGMTRGEFIEALYRLKTIRESGADSFVETTKPYSEEYTITIPALNIVNLTVSFADPFDSRGALEILHAGLGQYLSPPGAGHKMVLFGHSSGYNWDKSPYKTILTKIDQIQVGDMIYLNYHEKGYAYQVRQKEIRPAGDMASVMTDYGYEEMALYTCWPPNGIAKRYIVYADPL